MNLMKRRGADVVKETAPQTRGLAPAPPITHPPLGGAHGSLPLVPQTER
jgi:hypothetical protein